MGHDMGHVLQVYVHSSMRAYASAWCALLAALAWGQSAEATHFRGADASYSVVLENCKATSVSCEVVFTLNSAWRLSHGLGHTFDFGDSFTPQPTIFTNTQVSPGAVATPIQERLVCM